MTYLPAGLASAGSVQSASIILEVVGGGSHRLSPRGAVAQLGERLICIQEVAGSIPTSSTIHCVERVGPYLRPRAL